jgi:hypothetical protein
VGHRLNRVLHRDWNLAGPETFEEGKTDRGKEDWQNLPVADDSVSVLQFRIWLKDVSPSVWRRVPVPSTMTLREFHGVLQVAMGWEGIHLYQFIIHTARYGSWEKGRAIGPGLPA